MMRIGVAAVALMILSGCGGAAPAVEATPLPATPFASSSSSSPASAPPAEKTVQPVVLPVGVTAGVAVYDRQVAAFTYQHNVEQRFRSASLVKLFIAIDYLWSRETVPAAERQRLDLMLSRSDDNAASHFYNLGGRAAIIARMNQRLAINVVPPTAPRTGWGSTEVSAAHLVRVYRYLLDEAPPRIGQYIVGRLRKGTFTKCGTDGYDQSFGIPAAFPGRPWAAKQGWYEFASAPKTCASAVPAAYPTAVVPGVAPGAVSAAVSVAAPAVVPEVAPTVYGAVSGAARPSAVVPGVVPGAVSAAAPAVVPEAAPAVVPGVAPAGVPAAVPAGVPGVVPGAGLAAAPVDFSGEALHSTGIVGPNDRHIIVVLTVHRRGTAYSAATSALTTLAASLPLAP